MAKKKKNNNKNNEILCNNYYSNYYKEEHTVEKYAEEIIKTIVFWNENTIEEMKKIPESKIGNNEWCVFFYSRIIKKFGFTLVFPTIFLSIPQEVMGASIDHDWKDLPIVAEKVPEKIKKGLILNGSLHKHPLGMDTFSGVDEDATVGSTGIRYRYSSCKDLLQVDCLLYNSILNLLHSESFVNTTVRTPEKDCPEKLTILRGECETTNIILKEEKIWNNVKEVPDELPLSELEDFDDKKEFTVGDLKNFFIIKPKQPNTKEFIKLLLWLYSNKNEYHKKCSFFIEEEHYKEKINSSSYGYGNLNYIYGNNYNDKETKHSNWWKLGF